MAQFPFVYNFQSGRAYYGSSLDSNNKKPQQQFLSGPQTSFYEKDNPPSKIGRAALGLGVIAAAGFIPTGGGNRIWDFYVRGIRAVEEYSPAQILRTFQLSSFFSKYEKSTQGLKIPASMLMANRPLAEYYSKLIGGKKDVFSRVITEGLELRKETR